MVTKSEILWKYQFSPRDWSMMASMYFMLDKKLQEKFNKATIELSENATDLTRNEALFIQSFELDLKRQGMKSFLTAKAKKRLEKVV